MSARMLAFVICFCVLVVCGLGSLVTASVQMNACGSMCAPAGVRAFSLAQEYTKGAQPVCECVEVKS